MLKQLVFVILSLLNLNSFSQEINELWKQIHHTRNNRPLNIMAIDSDAQQNIYLIGNTFDTLWAETIVGTEIIHSSFNNTFFLEKLDRFGNLIWIKSLSKKELNTSPVLSVTNSGEVLLCNKIINEKREKEYFIQRYNAEGQLVLNKRIIKNISYENRCEINQIMQHSNGIIYLTGSFYNKVIIDGFNDTLYTSLAYNSDNFMLQLSSKGDFNWVTQIKGSGSKNINQFGTDESGNLFFAGSFERTCILEKDTLQQVSSAYDMDQNHFFFGKLNVKGEKQIFKTFDGAYSGKPSAIKLDKQGNIYVCGAFNGEVNFNVTPPISPEYYRMTSTFIGKLNPQFDPIWVKSIATPQRISGGQIYINKGSEIYWTGIFPGNVDFDPSDRIISFPITGDKYVDKFHRAIQKIDSEGHFLDLYIYPTTPTQNQFSKIVDAQTIVHSKNKTTEKNVESWGIFVKIDSNLFAKRNPLEIRTCSSYYWEVSKKTYTESGIYLSSILLPDNTYDTLQLHLTIESIDTSIHHDEKHIYSNAKDATFQWLDCENNYKPIRGETDSVFQFRETGTYCVEITSIYCDKVDTSERISKEMIGIHPADKRQYYSIDYHTLVDKIEREHVQLNPTEVNIIPFRDGPLYGFVKNGKKEKQFIKPRFEQVYAVYKEGAIVKDSISEYGLIDKKGNYLISPYFANLFKENGVYHGISYASKTAALKNLGDDSEHYVHFYFNEKGKLLFDERAHDFESFYYEDYAWFRFGKTYSVYNKSGELVKKFNVNRNNHFIGIADNKLLFNEDDSIIVAYDIKGEVDFKLPLNSYHKVYRLTSNLFGILADDADYYFCDSLGNRTTYSNTSYAIGFFQSDEAFFKQNQFVVRNENVESMTIIDRKGNEIVDAKYSFIGPLINGYRYCIDTLQKPSFIDVNGKRLALDPSIPPNIQRGNKRFMLAKNYGFYDGLAIGSKKPQWSDSLATEDGNTYYEWWEESDYYYYYDTTGQIVLTLSDTIALAGNFSDGLAPALTKNKKLGFIDKTGNWVIQPKYEISVAGAYPIPYIVVPYFSNGFAYIKSFKGYIDKMGNEYFTGKRMQDHYDFSH